MLAVLIAVPFDVFMISGVALWKSPCMLLKGWQRLCEDLVGREGPFLETVCVPFAGLSIILWPLAVIGAVVASFLSSFFFGMRAGLIAYQVWLAFSPMKVVAFRFAKHSYVLSRARIIWDEKG